MENLVLSEDQEIVYNKIALWLANGGIVTENQKNPNVLTFAGLAGSGKTTLLSHICKEFNNSVKFAFCALSGRAASVLGKKLKDQGVPINNGRHYCGTIHKLIYKPIENDKGEVIYWARNNKIDFDVIVIDEASMISEDIFNDLQRYGIDILAVGDHGQLPPIEGKFSLMKDPDLKLEKIHRQAQDNPIINLSFNIRNGKYDLKTYKNNDNISIIKRRDYLDFLQQTFKDTHNPEELLETAVLCYTNFTRSKLNYNIRKIIFGNYNSIPLTNDLVICLKNSNRNEKIPFYNGYRGYFNSPVEEYFDHYFEGKVNFPYEEIELNLNKICKYQFGFNKTFSSFDELKLFGFDVRHWSEVGLLFDYGYSLTCHKMQGSQANNVIIYNERPSPVSDDTYKRWLYTAVTRSSEKLTIII